MSLDLLLSRLDRVRPYGKQWRASCPSCGGSSRDKLSIAEGDGGRVLLHCFAGCDAAAVVQAAGLSLGDLFPERLRPETPAERSEAQRRFRESAWGGAIDTIAFEVDIVLACAESVDLEVPLSAADRERLGQAIERIHDAQHVLRPKRPMLRSAA